MRNLDYKEGRGDYYLAEGKREEKKHEWWEVWDIPSGNLLSDFPTKEEAEEFVASHAPDREGLVIGHHTDTGYSIEEKNG